MVTEGIDIARLSIGQDLEEEPIQNSPAKGDIQMEVMVVENAVEEPPKQNCPAVGLCHRSIDCNECNTKRRFRRLRRDQRRCERYFLGREILRLTHEGIPETEPEQRPRCQFEEFIMRYFGRRSIWIREKARSLQEQLDRQWFEFAETMRQQDPDFDLHYRRERRPTGGRGLAPRLPHDALDLDEGIFEWDDNYDPNEDLEDTEDDEPIPRVDPASELIFPMDL